MNITKYHIYLYIYLEVIMNIILAGIQGSGKGTQAKLISEKYGIHHISFGDTLKRCFKECPDLVLPYTETRYNNGELAEDKVLFTVANKYLPEIENIYGGFILDGFPRTEGQMNFVLNNYTIDMCIKINIPIDVAKERMLKRNRSDDTPTSIDNRINQYFKITEPIFELINKEKIYNINGTKSVTDIFTEITQILDKYA